MTIMHRMHARCMHARRSAARLMGERVCGTVDGDTADWSCTFSMEGTSVQGAGCCSYPLPCALGLPGTGWSPGYPPVPRLKNS